MNDPFVDHFLRKLMLFFWLVYCWYAPLVSLVILRASGDHTCFMFFPWASPKLEPWLTPYHYTMEFYDFHPNWRTPSFFRGVGIPPTSILYELVCGKTYKKPMLFFCKYRSFPFWRRKNLHGNAPNLWFHRKILPVPASLGPALQA